MSKQCDLCELKKLTKWHHEDGSIVVCDCIKCHVPMVVLKRHTMEPTEEEVQHMENTAHGLFPNQVDNLRKDQREIPDHLHWHVILQAS